MPDLKPKDVARALNHLLNDEELAIVAEQPDVKTAIAKALDLLGEFLPDPAQRLKEAGIPEKLIEQA